MTWVLAALVAAFFVGIALDERRVRREDRCIKSAQARLEREIAERGDR